MNDKAEKATWPDFVIVLFDLLSGRKAEVTWEFQNLELHVPITTGGGPHPWDHWSVDLDWKRRLRLVPHATKVCCCGCRCGHVGDAVASSKRSVMSTAFPPSAPVTPSRQTTKGAWFPSA